ncbi:MAG: shikimate dehydrogenase, partial [Acidobacteriota bacterium]
MRLSTPLPRICIALGLTDPEALVAHARTAYDAGERFFEFRLDYLPRPEQGIGAIRDFLKECSEASLLATCRRRLNQGRFNGS